MSDPKFIQNAIKHPGLLRRMLRIPAGELIPIEFLIVIVNTPIGMKAKNPTNIGVKTITVTLLVHQRSQLVLTMRGFHPKKKITKKARSKK